MPLTKVPKHDIAVIIVNYNVKSFLNFCLESVYAASNSLDVEILVVDNASTDGSVAFLKMWHPQIKIIESSENQGFSRACNQAVLLAHSNYVLFLNPDTIIAESTLEECFNYYRSSSDVGALGAKMIDGSGKFLPESKRGRISPSSAFYKLIGLSRLFANSSRYNKYYLGHLDENKSHIINTLTGAFFFTSRQILDEIGLFDEQFFMYAEDIDLSRRIEEYGKKIIYLPTSTIIHFKGESTEKSSLKYYESFYGSMKLYVNKYYSKRTEQGFNILLSLGIFFNGFWNFIHRVLKKTLPPLFDLTIIGSSLYLVSQFWASFYYRNPQYYEREVLYFNILLYTIVWSALLIINGVYNKKFNIGPTLRSIFQGLIIILMIYALLGDELRSSRAVILLGFALIMTVLPLLKWISAKLLNNSSNSEIYFHSKPSMELLGLVQNLNFKKSTDESCLNHLFDIKKMEFVDMIATLARNNGKGVGLFWDSQKQLLISSSNKKEKGQNVDEKGLYQINSTLAQISKRTFDVITSLILIILYPVNVFLSHNDTAYFHRVIDILKGRHTIISYMDMAISNELPKIKTGYVPMLELRSIEEQNLMAKDYALHYSLLKDMTIFISYYVKIVKHLSR